MLQTGSKLGGTFEILGPLGSGAMGEVYRARDLKLGREVAIKVLPKDLAGDAERLARFEQEARTVSGLNHPNIVTVHDVGHDGDIVYLVLELVQGKTLRDRLAKGGLPWRSTLHIAEQIAAGLAAAHAGGIVHRDLKPENVMVRDDGVVKVLDFGLAKLRSASAAGLGTATAFTSPGTVLGTAGYMSPEQARGEDVDARSDQFALGAILYEMATGERPFTGASTAQTLTAIIEKDPEPVTRSRADAPRPLVWILDRCLAKDPRDRYGSTLDLARDLRNVREHLSEISSSSQVAAAGVAPPRSGRRAAPLIVVCSLVAAAAGGTAVAFIGRARPALEPPALRAVTFSGFDYAPCASADGRMLAFTSRRDGVPRIWLKSLADAGEVPLTAGPDEGARFSPDGSSVLFARWEPGGQSLYRVPTLGGEPRKVAQDARDGDWSPDGTRVAFLRLKTAGGTTVTSILSARADGGDEKELLQVKDGALAALRWSPDGKQIVVSVGMFGGSESAGKFLQIVGADGSAPRRVMPAVAGGDVSGAAWVDGGRKLVYSQGESMSTVSLGGTTVNSSASRVVLQDVQSGKSRVLFWTPALANMVSVAGPGILVFDAASSRQNLQEWDFTGTPPVRTATLSEGTSLDRQPVYSPDGEWVAFSSNRSGNLDLWARSRHTGELRRLTDDPADDWDPAFTRDGKHLIWTSRRGGNFEIWMGNADGSSPRQVTHDGVDAENATATPDGEWIVYNSGHPSHAGVWKVRADGSDATLLVKGTTAWPEVSPDGTVACYTGSRTNSLIEVAFVRIADGAKVPFSIELEAFELGSGRSRWMPDGRSVAVTWHTPRGSGIYAQDYRPGQDTSASRRALVTFDTQNTPESFGIAPDGRHLAVAISYHGFSVMTATGVAGVDGARR